MYKLPIHVGKLIALILFQLKMDIYSLNKNIVSLIE